MTQSFFERPILNSPYRYPDQHWEIDADGRSTHKVVDKRRRAEFLTPIPKPRRQRGAGEQREFGYGDDKGISSEQQAYEHAAIINGVREHVDRWRLCPNRSGKSRRKPRGCSSTGAAARSNGTT